MTKAKIKLVVLSVLISVTVQVNAAKLLENGTGLLVVMRHGESGHNISGTYNTNPEHENHVPSNLTAKGVSQVENTAMILMEQGINGENTQLIYYSPMPRTLQTASHLAEKLNYPRHELIEKIEIGEINSGNREGQSFSCYPWDAALFKKDGGEDDASVRKRIKTLILDIIAKLKNEQIDADKNIILVTHSLVARLIIEYLSGFPVLLDTAGFTTFPLHNLEARLRAYPISKEYAATCSAAKKLEDGRQMFTLEQMKRYSMERKLL